ncbi:DUF341 domain protein [Hypoxylon cercidicola]|nr:DUF341 domain protein [Hypoxylon cercidicola]
MRFLCLHGSGTNSKIFENQTAALRYQLGDHYTFDFVEGNLRVSMAPEFEGVASPSDNFFQYAAFDNLASYVTALDQLDAYLRIEGPFDGILAFSQGAAIAITYLVRRMWQNPVAEHKYPTFKCAIFFSAGGAYDPTLLEKGEVRLLTPEVDGEVIHIPTMHVWGSRDDTVNALEASAICKTESRQIHVHGGGHEIPGVRMDNDLRSCVTLMRRVVAMAGREEGSDEEV